MEINEQKLKGILKEQKDDFQKHVDKSLNEQRKEYQNYLAIVAEDFKSQVKLIAEQHESIIEKLDSHDAKFISIEEKLDSHDAKFISIEENIGAMKVNIEIMKVDISFIKGGLKQKVDVEDFSALERRVILLEAKMIKN